MHELKNATPIKKLLPEVAKENNVDLEMLTDVFDNYYMELNKEIAKAKRPVLILLGFGRLKLSKNKITFTIEKMKEFLKREPEDSVKYKMQTKYFNHQRLLKLERSLKEITEDEKRNEKRYKNRLEKQEGNL